MFLLLMILGQVVFNNEISAEIAPTFWEQILGTVPISTYLAGGVFIAIGILISWYFKSKKAQKTNPNTPTTFSWKLFFLTKIPRKITSIIVGIIVGFVAMRFVTDILGLPLTMFICFVIGVTFDNIIVKISKLQLPLK
jgi:putative Mn2+ efflux pump MntP